MNEFPSDIRFKFAWRNYQQRVLNELERHLDDKHLHIVAPPGSGKTVLGLEVALLINKPTLILAPSLAIRNQWVHRFCELFLQTPDIPEWISTDIRNPKFFTAITYQGLHAACTYHQSNAKTDICEKDESEAARSHSVKSNILEIIGLLEGQNVGTIIVDEAHHLKNEWWKSLNAVKNALKPTVVGLTATPPYDVSYLEWQRYIDLNGPVDAEISIPELVAENDLCPHQDYIYLSSPTDVEKEMITGQRDRTLLVYEELKNDTMLIDAVSRYPVFQLPLENLEWIYDNLECYSAILIFLNAAGKEITEAHLEVIGDKKFKIPDLNFDWMEILLGFYLYQDIDHFFEFEEHKGKIINKLKRNGLLERKSIRFEDNPRINRLLSSSLSKLESIDRIVDIEHDSMGNDLRMVILTDFIRKEYLIQEAENKLELKNIGVLSIFEKLRRTNDRCLKMGVLTGSLVIIPELAVDALMEAAGSIQAKRITIIPLVYDKNYFIINTLGDLDLVQLITRIFEEGKINVLIGTKSLLGEGWDAPAVNSLILASFVGSFVLSNQMRGRAIRVDKRNSDKTSNIWHLACVDATLFDGGDDVQLMKRRFKSFVGISFNDQAPMENGVKRLLFPEKFVTNDINGYNELSILEAGKREKLYKKWQDAISCGIELVEEIKVPFPRERNYKKIQSLYYNKTIANLLAVLGSGILGFSQQVLNLFFRSTNSFKSPEEIFRWFILAGIGGVLLFGWQSFTAIRLFLKYRDISKDIQQIGEALLLSLIKTRDIQTNSSTLKVKSSVDEQGAIFCHLAGGTTYEKSVFTKSLFEIVSAIDNPRYIIIRKNFFINILAQKDYHSVPDILGRKKKTADYFAQQWKQLVGNCRLVYTRNLEGRKILLKSKIHSLASEFEENAERINVWR